MKTFKRAALLAAGVLLASCGGGGGGDGGGGTTPPPANGTFQVSGQVSIGDNTLVDSDVNDVLAAHAANDDFATAQTLPNPGILAGYVNVAGQGPAGRSQAAGDRSDFFQINANAGQVISLIVATPGAGDVDLYLFNEAHAEIANSRDTGKLESIPVTASGKYFIVAHAFSGASNYVLTVGQPVAATALADAGVLSSHAEFVPGEVIVRWRSSAAAAQRTEKRSASTIMAANALSRVAGAPEGDWLLKLDDPASTLMQAGPNPRASRLEAGAVLSKEQLKSATVDAIKQLRADPDVEFAEPNYIRRALAVPNDPFYNRQWHYPSINLPAAWDITRGSNSVTVAVIDTGVLLNHPELRGQLVPGYDFISDPASARDGNGRDNNPDDPGDLQYVNGTSTFHGTHVAGTIAAATNNALGVAGIAANARVMPLRVLGAEGGTDFDISQAVLYAAGLPNASGTVPARRADIINLSLGGYNSSQAAQDVFTSARNAGVIIVAAAGNDDTSQRMYPAAYDGVISVSATTINKTLAGFSNFGATIDVAAPGGAGDGSDANGDGSRDDVLSTRADDSSGQIVYNLDFLHGTSMAAPHVAGVLALMKSVNPALTPNQIDTLLAAGRLTVDLGAAGRDDSFGHGLIDALKAVQAAANATGDTPALLVAAPTALNFSPGVSSQNIVVRNGGDLPLQVTAVQVAPANAWLTVARPAAANGVGTYTVNVNRGTLAPGAYSGTVSFVSAGGTVVVSVVMQVTAGGATVRSDLGQHYVILVNATTREPVYQVIARATNGLYNFQFSNVASGTYHLVAGSDANNDDSICNVGEACGAYVSLQDPTTVTINGNRTGLNFSSGYVTSIAATAAAARVEAAQPQGFKRLR
jgi:serine protease